MKHDHSLNVAVIGASGYTGVELIRLLLHHEYVNIAQLIAQSSAGKTICELYPHLAPYDLPDVIPLEQADFSNVDIVFCCLPHATTQQVVKGLPEHVKIIDLSADFRLKNVETYATWYGHEHLAPELQQQAVYGLTEIYKDAIKQARLVACPGCYPTGASLALYPLLIEQLIDTQHIIIDAKSGVTGMGRSLKQAGLYCEANEGVKAYGICSHRHMPEIEQTLSEATGSDIQVHFTPQLVPMSRGILSTIYVTLQADQTTDSLRNHLQASYENEPFIHICPDGILPSTRDVHGTNQCFMAVTQGRHANTAVIVTAIDNLTKGSSGQALQNMNIMCDLPETTGLTQVSVYP